ncbi:MAG TPA: phosphatidate cytidylyltransferase [Micromonosporaceae bacterium]|nr:phosphatidate cytidylyltransferase [Micromonosporaceae bacterium]
MSYLDPYGSSDPRGREEEGRSLGRSRQAAGEDQWSRSRHGGAAPDGYAPTEPGQAYEGYGVEPVNGYSVPTGLPNPPMPAGFAGADARNGTYHSGLDEPGYPPDRPGPTPSPGYSEADTAAWPQVAGASPRPAGGRRRAAHRAKATDRPAGNGRAGRNLPAAIAVGLGLATVILTPLFVYRPAFLLVLAAAAGVGVWEMVRAVRASGARPPLIPLLAGGVLTVGLAWWGGPDALTLGLLVTVVAAVLWRLADGLAGFRRDAAAAVVIAVYVPFLAGFAAMLAVPSDGQWRVLVTLAAVVLSDTGGYAAGVFLGKHPMAPTVSPKKSWEGFGGSVVAAATGSAVLLFFLLDLDPWWGALFGLAVCGTAVLGDLGESMLKRDLGIKDMSNLLPGHGGLMDRLDSILFAVPTAYLILSIFLPEM